MPWTDQEDPTDKQVRKFVEIFLLVGIIGFIIDWIVRELR